MKCKEVVVARCIPIVFFELTRDYWFWQRAITSSILIMSFNNKFILFLHFYFSDHRSFSPSVDFLRHATWYYTNITKFLPSVHPIHYSADAFSCPYCIDSITSSTSHTRSALQRYFPKKTQSRLFTLHRIKPYHCVSLGACCDNTKNRVSCDRGHRRDTTLAHSTIDISKFYKQLDI
jgi:hypothetical protein